MNVKFLDNFASLQVAWKLLERKKLVSGICEKSHQISGTVLGTFFPFFFPSSPNRLSQLI